MMKSVWVLAVVIILSACKPGEKKDDAHAEDTNAIELNNSEKWQVNAEMTPHIEKGEALLKSYLSKEDGDIHELASALKAENDALVKSCTMKGESHDELHKWLHPHMELVASVEKVQNPKEEEKVLAALQKSFKTYHQYFE